MSNIVCNLSRWVVLRDGFILKNNSTRGCLILGSKLRVFDLFIIIAVFDEVVEFLKVEECVSNSMRILLLIDEVMRLNLPLLHLLLVILTHQLGEGAIKLAHIIRK